jgi:hypothetical protein
LRRPTTALAAWLTVKLPTGDADSHGRRDRRPQPGGQTQLAEHWHLPGRWTPGRHGDILPELQKSYAWSVLAGVMERVARARPDGAVRRQLESSRPGHLAGDAVVLSFGGISHDRRWCYGFGSSEDVQVDACPTQTSSLPCSARLNGVTVRAILAATAVQTRLKS